MAADGTITASRLTSTRRRAFTNWLGNSSLSLLENTALSLTVPVVGSIWLSDVSRYPVASFCFNSRSYASTGRRAPFLSLAEHLGKVVFGDREDNGNGLQLGDHHQPVGVGCMNDVARVHNAQADPPAERRGYAAVNQL